MTCGGPRRDVRSGHLLDPVPAALAMCHVVILHPNVAGAAPTWEAHFMAESWGKGLSTEVDKGILVDRETTLLSVHFTRN